MFLFSVVERSLYCPTVFDGVLCWPPTKAGEKVFLQCPVGVRGLDHESKSRPGADVMIF
jgi:hypothetical protein